MRTFSVSAAFVVTLAWQAWQADAYAQTPAPFGDTPKPPLTTPSPGQTPTPPPLNPALGETPKAPPTPPSSPEPSKPSLKDPALGATPKAPTNEAAAAETSKTPPKAPPVVPTTPVEGEWPELPPLGDARPALPPPAEPAPLAWHNHLEVGGGFAVAELPAHVDGTGAATRVRFGTGPGFHLDLSWQIFKYLRFTGYMSEHDHTLQLPSGSLGITCSSGSSCIQGSAAHMYNFGARVSPTLPLGKRVRLWLTAGVGWGRVEYPRYAVTAASPYTIQASAESFFEVPLGLGGSVEIIPRWLSLRVEATGSVIPSQIGDALGDMQVIRNGGMATVGAMPKLDAYFLETIGLSLHL